MATLLAVLSTKCMVRKNGSELAHAATLQCCFVRTAPGRTGKRRSSGALTHARVRVAMLALSTGLHQQGVMR